ncbi:phosphate signaling complex protein PhoU [Natrialba asiatica]|uniref:Phosphate-specific transport system accessory protein PhoU n=1 Tax=Natrialba asiatica (strain ATCC 700177 / DSM 12278 / JCM 9576 / FERM P-10747 / NBRC 102637 / 172P1) TaxID=29540 RepID=M0B4Q7_NATA1|nr:phosphate signaling complex protein PhoU [Natrialba asiatica]ELZ05243.1 phosphate uptake regulator PhoU [Natrialba asiatica DSM 12278]
MAREDYCESLTELRDGVESMAKTVLTQLRQALESLEDGDETLARKVIDNDEIVNERYLDLEGDCINLLALQQPVASDLRFVAASFKILTDLERIGDLATNLARYALAGASRAFSKVDIHRIGDEVRNQVQAAIDAYVADDTDACRTIDTRDDEIDALCQRASEAVVRELIAREADAWGIEQLLDDVSRVLLTIRDLERIGDHAVNVAARTHYMVENDPELIY